MDEMTPEQLQEIELLKAYQAELAGYHRQPWEPSCISAAFASTANAGPWLFTMQVWIDLDAIRSPVLLGRLPDEDILPQLHEALVAFGHPEPAVGDLEPGEALRLFELMTASVREGFVSGLKMRPPRGDSGSTSQDGFGSWLPIIACLISQMGLSLQDAKSMLVRQALPLIAAHRRNEGWTPSGETYAERDIPQD